MGNKFEERNIKNHTCYFFDDMINIKNLHLNKIKIYENSYINIVIYYIKYVTFNDLKCAKTKTVNS